MTTLRTCLLLMAASTTAAAPPALKKPPALGPGSTVRIVAPAGPFKADRLERGVEWLRDEGFTVVVPEGIERAHGYLAGTDAERAAELTEALLDPKADAVVCVRGGYGVMRLLDLVDWEKVALARPKVVVGFSDVTALHAALASKCGWITFHGPNLDGGPGRKKGFVPFARDSLRRNLFASENRGEAGWAYSPPEGAPLAALAPGAAEGPFCGGNLSLVAALCGTPFEPKTKGRVLFLEDLNEQPYRVDRMLSQLKHAGLLKAPAAVVLGKFTDCEPAVDEPSLTLDQVFADYFAGAEFPVVTNFPAGHVPANATLPLGARVRVDADKLEVRVLENPVTVK